MNKDWLLVPDAFEIAAQEAAGQIVHALVAHAASVREGHGLEEPAVAALEAAVAKMRASMVVD